MSRIGAAEQLIKNLPIVVERANLIKGILTFNVAFYAFYQVSSGPTKLRL